MSFIGIITRKEQDTGVSLCAKVVTPNKKKSAKKIFRVKVKADVLDDLTCCVLDHAISVDRINTQNKMSEIVTDITPSMGYSGEHGTVISYRIIDINEPKLSKYLGENGAILNRPKYGEGNANGYLEITVSKGEESVTSRIQASVSSILATEVLASDTFSNASMWNAIKGKNIDPYQAASEWSGHNNVMDSLALLKTMSVPTMSNEPVNIEWSVNDKTVAYADMKNLYSEPRINLETGDVSRISYKDAYTLVDALPGVTIKVVQGNSSGTNNTRERTIRIGGITLTATLTLGDATSIVTFECATISKYLTNKEVLDAVLENLALIRPDYSTIRYMEDPVAITLSAPSSGGKYVLKAHKNAIFYSAPNLGLNSIDGAAITNELKAFDGLSAYGETVRVFDGGFQSDITDGENYNTLTLNYNAIKDVEPTWKKFSCVAYIRVDGYSKNGLTRGGAGEELSRYIPFNVDTSLLS